MIATIGMTGTGTVDARREESKRKMDDDFDRVQGSRLPAIVVNRRQRQGLGRFGGRGGPA